MPKGCESPPPPAGADTPLQQVRELIWRNPALTVQLWQAQTQAALFAQVLAIAQAKGMVLTQADLETAWQLDQTARTRRHRQCF